MGKSVALIKFWDQVDKSPRVNQFKSMSSDALAKRHEQYLASTVGKWEWAVIYTDGDAWGYYHHSTGADRHDEKEYNKVLYSTRTNLYIIYQDGSTETKVNQGIEDIHLYMSEDVQRIRVYLNNQMIDEVWNNS